MAEDMRNAVMGQGSGPYITSGQRNTVIGDGVGEFISAHNDCTVIGFGGKANVALALAFRSMFGVSPVDQTGDLNGRILLQFGPELFDMEDLLNAAKERRDSLSGGASVHDLIKDRAAMQEMKKFYGIRDN